MRRIVTRSVVIWLGVRGALAMLGTGVAPGPSFDLTLPATALTVAVVGWLGMLDLTRRNERLFLATLGVRDRTMIGLACVAPAMLELGIQAVW